MASGIRSANNTIPVNRDGKNATALPWVNKNVTGLEPGSLNRGLATPQILVWAFPAHPDSSGMH